MKNLFKYMLLLVVVLAFVGCANDDYDAQPVGDKAGEDVQFGLSLANSRTIYGPESVEKDGAGNITNRSFPIYWSDGDKVQIYSPDCPAPRNNAEYSVKPVSNQSYAESLTKTGPYGVQWGQNSVAKFYSVYPSDGASFETKNGNVTAKLKVAGTQTAYTFLNVEEGVGVYYVDDMKNVIMYAQTGEIKAGEVVNLQYNPFSTVLEFEIDVTGTGTALVNSITLEADEFIVGDFNLTFNGGVPVAEPAGNNSKTLVMNFGVKPELNSDNSNSTADKTIKNSKMRVKLCLMPIGIKDINNWTLTVATKEGADEVNHTKTFSGTSALTPGKIHKVKLPTITATKAWEYKPEVWMTQIPEYQTVYLTEYSIPGAWYAHDPKPEGYQASGESISRLWQNGVRAFAVECRSAKDRSFSTSPKYVSFSGTGDSGIGNDAYIGGTKIREVIKAIANQVANTQEFAVLVLSYADGGEKGQRDVDHEFFINGLKTEIANSGVTNIFNKEITPATTTADVIGQLIIKVNVDAEIPKSSYDDSANVLFSYVPHMNQLSSTLYSTPLFSKMYWKIWNDGYKSYSTEFSDSEFYWCFSSANRTHTDGTGTYEIPTYQQRKDALYAMIEHSKAIYEKSTHNVWFYFNVGGTEATGLEGSTSMGSYATEMNKWLFDVIDVKTNGGKDYKGNLVQSHPSPLGIVMFNECSSDQGKKIIRAIVEMNNKFELKHGVAKSREAYDNSLNSGGNVY